MKRLLQLMGGLCIAVLCLSLWAASALDYGDAVVSGVYTFKGSGETSTLTLNSDHTFRQARTLGDVRQQAEGTWRRLGEGVISFSKEFLVVTGDEPEPDGTTVCDVHKLLGVIPSLRLRQYHVLWYGKTSPGNSPVGTYEGDEPNVVATLTLGINHSFLQELTRDHVVTHAIGTWNQDSQSTIWFSKQFLKTSAVPLSATETASSIDPQGSNLQIQISQVGQVAEPVFRKHLLF